MSTLIAKPLSTITHLEFMTAMPAGSRLFLPNVSWADYEYLLGEITDNSPVRLSYDQGELEFMTLSPQHESLKVLFSHLLSILTDELGLGIISLGSTTFKLPEVARGTEPDDCFYIRRAAAIEGNETIDLAIDPGPDLVIEVDLSHPSLNKMPIYASLDVTELWRFDGQILHFYLLSNGDYQESSSSDLFPFLTPKVLCDFLLPGKLRDINKMKKIFREWVRTNK
jgi:Uma2 family endonuclease